MPVDNRVFVIIPAYNEDRCISKVIEEVKKYTSNIIVVDDGSNDKTFDILRNFQCVNSELQLGVSTGISGILKNSYGIFGIPEIALQFLRMLKNAPHFSAGIFDIAKENGIIVLRHITNLGKGAALKTGCEFAIKKGADFLVFIDADGQHEAKEIPNFVEALKDVDIVFGYRRLYESMPFILKLGNYFINKSIKWLYSLDLKDTQCGYRAFRTKVYEKIRWRALDYSVESEIIANVGKNHLRYKEIPIKTIYNSKYKGTTVIDGFKIVLNMVLWRIRG